MTVNIRGFSCCEEVADGLCQYGLLFVLIVVVNLFETFFPVDFQSFISNGFATYSLSFKFDFWCNYL